MYGKLRKFSLALAGGAVTALLMSMAGVGMGTAAAERVQAGNIMMNVDGFLKPSRLPARGMAPASLTVRGNLRDINGDHPQRMDVMVLDFDKAGRTINQGLPVCRPEQIENTTPQVAYRTCKDALIGRGKANAQVKFPDQAAFQAPADNMLLFNMRGRGRHPGIVVHAYAFTPLPTTFVVPVRFTNSPNRRLYHHRTIVRIPLIAGGNGSMTMFDATLNRRWRFRGRPRSFINAGCPRRVHRAEGMFRFRGGPVVNASIAKRCQQRPTRRRR